MNPWPPACEATYLPVNPLSIGVLRVRPSQINLKKPTVSIKPTQRPIQCRYDLYLLQNCHQRFGGYLRISNILLAARVLPASRSAKVCCGSLWPSICHRPTRTPMYLGAQLKPHGCRGLEDRKVKKKASRERDSRE